jgi:hypothetical protein
MFANNPLPVASATPLPNDDGTTQSTTLEPLASTCTTPNPHHQGDTRPTSSPRREGMHQPRHLCTVAHVQHAPTSTMSRPPWTSTVGASDARPPPPSSPPSPAAADASATHVSTSASYTCVRRASTTTYVCICRATITDFLRRPPSSSLRRANQPH